LLQRRQVSARAAAWLLAAYLLGLAGCPTPSPDNEPVADFSASPLSGQAPLVVQFTDLSTVAAGEIAFYYWDFGDGRQSHNQSPLHVYQTADTYTVSLTVTTPSGTDTMQKTAYIGVSPTNDAATVQFGDANLEAAIREATEKPTGPITVGEARAIQGIEIVDYIITNLSGLQHFTGLEYLRISGAYGGGKTALDLAPLSALTNLTQLQLDECGIVDLGPLVTLENLSILYMYGNFIEDIAPLADLANLAVLYAYNNSIEDLSPLAALTGLQILNLYGNSIEDVTPLQSLIQLQTLYLDNNLIADVTPLAGLSALKTLYLGINNITDISPLSYLPSLQTLGLNDNQISNISSLYNLENLSILYLEGNPLVPATACSTIEALSAEGVIVYHDLECQTI